MKVAINFSMRIDVDDVSDIDDLGEAIAHDIFQEMFNGDDFLEIEYTGNDLKKLVDLQLNIDGLILDGISIDEFIQNIPCNSEYPITYNVLHEEGID